MINHNAPSGIFSAYNPIVTLKPKIKREVNEKFILPIVQAFFGESFGSYQALNLDKLKTEIEFNAKDTDEGFVKSYVYKEIVNEISKPNKEVEFKPKYVITFDWDLTDFDTQNFYPHKPHEPIRYGAMRLGNAPILYYIYVDFQDFIKFIKSIRVEETLELDKEEESKEGTTPKEKRNRLVDMLLLENHQKMLLEETNETEKAELQANEKRLLRLREEEIEGKEGKLRVNLMWDTEDDLDLHIETPTGEKIYHGKKLVEYQGVIGELDIDKNASTPFVSNPQENVNWDKMPIGVHKIIVDFYKSRRATRVNFILQIIPNDSIHDGRIYQSFVESTGEHKMREIVTFEYEGDELKYTELIRN